MDLRIPKPADWVAPGWWRTPPTQQRDAAVCGQRFRGWRKRWSNWNVCIVCGQWLLIYSRHVYRVLETKAVAMSICWDITTSNICLRCVCVCGFITAYVVVIDKAVKIFIVTFSYVNVCMNFMRETHICLIIFDPQWLMAEVIRDPWQNRLVETGNQWIVPATEEIELNRPPWTCPLLYLPPGRIQVYNKRAMTGITYLYI